MSRIASVILAALAVSAHAFATDIHVAPGQSIQAAVNAAQNGDRVLVQAGTYPGAIEVASKAIELIGTAGALVTTIDATGAQDSAVTLSGNGIRLVGFRITGGIGKSSGGFPLTKRYGGGIYSIGLTSIEQCIIEDNTTFGGFQAPGGAQGGGAYITPSAQGTAHVLRCIVRDNLADIGAGLYGGRIEQCVVESNDATLHGGGIVFPTEIRSSRIVGNTAKLGGGVFCGGATIQLAFEDVLLEGNTAERGGGAYIQLTAGNQGNFTSTIGGLRFVDNTASLLGGGLAIELGHSGISPPVQAHTILVRGCTFANNLSVPASGAGLNLGLQSSGPTLPNCIAAIDRCSFVGDDAKLQANASVITNSAFVNNATPLIIVSGTIQVDACIVPGTFPGTGSFTANPGFFDVVNGDLHIMAGSPALELGVATANGVAPFDFEGDAIVGVPDIGADERAPHVYLVGSLAPGSTVDLRVAGTPGAQATMFLSLTKLTTPIVTSAGLFGLGFPISFDLPLGTIPASGVLSAQATIPASSPLFATAYMQVVLQSGGSAQLTNVGTIVIM